MDAIENMASIHAPEPSFEEKMKTNFNKILLADEEFSKLQLRTLGDSKRLTTLENAVQGLKESNLGEVDDVYKLTMKQMMALPAAADLHRLIQWLAKEEDDVNEWNTWWEQVIHDKRPKKVFFTASLVVQRVLQFTNQWHADPAAMSMETLSLELTTLSALLENLSIPMQPEKRFQKLLKKLFKQAPFTLRQVMEEWNELWDEDAVVHLNVMVFGNGEVNTVVDTPITGWQPSKFNTPKLTPLGFPENFREVFDRCRAGEDKAECWANLNNEDVGDGVSYPSDGDTSIVGDLNDSRTTESDMSDVELVEPVIAPPSPKKPKKQPKYVANADFLPAKPSLFQRPKTYEEVVQAQQIAWASKQATKKKN